MESATSEVAPQTGQSIQRRDAEIAEVIHWSSQRTLRLCGESKLDSFAPSFQFQDSKGRDGAPGAELENDRSALPRWLTGAARQRASDLVADNQKVWVLADQRSASGHLDGALQQALEVLDPHAGAGGHGHLPVLDGDGRVEPAPVSLGSQFVLLVLCRDTQAIALEPSNAEAYGNLGSALGKSGRYKESAEALKEAVRLKPTFADAHFALGLAYISLGDRNPAIKQSQALDRLDPALAKKLRDMIAAFGARK